MARNGGDFSGRRVEENGMAATFAKKSAAMGFRMANEIDPLH